MTASRVLLLLPWLPCFAACTDPAPDEAPGDPSTTITITTQRPTALVAFRDFDGAWQTAKQISPTVAEAQVHGPYLVTLVCQQPAGRVRLFQDARTLDDDHAITHSCALTQHDHKVTGHMVQAGEVTLDTAIDSSDTASWDFSLSVEDGSYDLVARTDDWIAIRRDVAVHADLALPTIDVAREGKLLVDAHLTTVASPGEELSAYVSLATPSTTYAGVSFGPLENARIAPDAVLEADDVQNVIVSAAHGSSSRSLERSFRVGDDPAFALPEPLVAQLSLDGNLVTAAWSTLPAFDRFSMSATAFGDAGELWLYNLLATPHFLAETGLHELAIDTRVPGFAPAWRIDFTRPYLRSVSIDRMIGEGYALSSVDDTLPASHN